MSRQWIWVILEMWAGMLSEVTSLYVPGVSYTTPPSVWGKPHKEKRTPLSPDKQDGRVFNLEALDCRKPEIAYNYLTADVCKGKGAHPEPLIESTKVFVLQKSKDVERKAVRCRKVVSTFDAICGAFSHSKLMAPPIIEVEEMMPLSTCQGMQETKTFTDETGRQHFLHGGRTVIEYQYMAAGQLSYSPNNVYCR